MEYDEAGVEPVFKLHPQKQAAFGAHVTFDVTAAPPDTHLLGELVLALALPGLRANALEQVRYVDPVLMIDEVWLTVNGATVGGRQTGQFMALYKDMMKEAWGVEQAFLDRQAARLTAFGEQVPGATVYVPLTLFFCTDPKAALPLFRFPDASVELHVKLRPFHETYMTRRDPFVGRVRVPGSRRGTAVELPEPGPRVGLNATYLRLAEANRLFYEKLTDFLISETTPLEPVALRGEGEVVVQGERFQTVAAPVQRVVWYAQLERNAEVNDHLNLTAGDVYGREEELYNRAAPERTPPEHMLTDVPSLADRVQGTHALMDAVAGATTLEELVQRQDAVNRDLADLAYSNRAAAYNVHLDLQHTQGVVDGAFQDLHAVERGVLDYVDDHAAYLWRTTGRLEERLGETGAEEEHLLLAAEIRDGGEDVVPMSDYRLFYHLRNAAQNNAARYHVYGHDFGQPLAQLVDVGDVPNRRVDDLTLRVRVNRDHVRADQPARLFVHLVTFGVLRVDAEGRVTTDCHLGQHGAVWTCSGQPAAAPPPKLRLPDSVLEELERRDRERDRDRGEIARLQRHVRELTERLRTDQAVDGPRRGDQVAFQRETVAEAKKPRRRRRRRVAEPAPQPVPQAVATSAVTEYAADARGRPAVPQPASAGPPARSGWVVPRSESRARTESAFRSLAHGVANVVEQTRPDLLRHEVRKEAERAIVVVQGKPGKLRRPRADVSDRERVHGSVEMLPGRPLPEQALGAASLAQKPQERVHSDVREHHAPPTVVPQPRTPLVQHKYRFS